jgi:hypothetical protein
MSGAFHFVRSITTGSAAGISLRPLHMPAMSAAAMTQMRFIYRSCATAAIAQGMRCPAKNSCAALKACS